MHVHNAHVCMRMLAHACAIGEHKAYTARKAHAHGGSAYARMRAYASMCGFPRIHLHTPLPARGQLHGVIGTTQRDWYDTLCICVVISAHP